MPKDAKKYYDFWIKEANYELANSGGGESNHNRAMRMYGFCMDKAEEIWTKYNN